MFKSLKDKNILTIDVWVLVALLALIWMGLGLYKMFNYIIIAGLSFHLNNSQDLKIKGDING